jgi:hypothetical protein
MENCGDIINFLQKKRMNDRLFLKLKQTILEEEKVTSCRAYFRYLFRGSLYKTVC